jgi:hypothetical protein
VRQRNCAGACIRIGKDNRRSAVCPSVAWVRCWSLPCSRRRMHRWANQLWTKPSVTHGCTPAEPPMRHERPHVREETGKRRISTASLYWALQTPFESRKVQNIAVRAPLKVGLNSSHGLTKPSQHQADGRQAKECHRGPVEILEVLRQPPPALVRTSPGCARRPIVSVGPRNPTRCRNSPAYRALLSANAFQEFDM